MVKPSSQKTRPGGTYCCVPGCSSNCRRDKHLKYYVIPKDVELRKKWLRNISRAGKKGKFSEWVPTKFDRLCSLHFEGGQKTYMINVPTIFPLKKVRKPPKPRRRLCRTRVMESVIEHDSSKQPDSNMSVVSEYAENSDTSLTTSVCADHCYADVPRESLEELKSELKLQRNLVSEMAMKIIELEAEITCLKKGNDDHNKTICGLESEKLRLERKYDKLSIRHKKVKKRLMAKTLSIGSIKNKQHAMKFYTGFATYNEFLVLYNFLCPDFKDLCYWGSRSNCSKTGKRILSHENELLLVLARLRCGLLTEDLAFRFGVHKSTVSRICRTYFDLMYQRFRQIPIFSSRQTVQRHMPDCFKLHYPSTRIILDCTELFIQRPSHYRVQAETFSSYKNHNTAKGLVGITPDGFLCFVTDLAPGRTSDKAITEKSGLIDHLQEGDSVMADRGFVIDEYLARKRVKLNIPPFMSGKTQLSPAEEQETRRVASVRIHVERVIERIKNFQILNQVFPNSMSTELNKIWVICCYLVNFVSNPIVGKQCNDANA